MIKPKDLQRENKPGPIQVKVVRVLEYTFNSYQQAEMIMNHWSVPANGSKAYPTGEYIRSAVIQPYSELRYE